MRISITTTLLDYVRFVDDTICGESEVSDNFQCYHMTKLPTVDDWIVAYRKDKSTNCILVLLLHGKESIWENIKLSTIAPEFHS